MAGIKLTPEDSDISQQRTAASATPPTELVSDDDRSVAADSWSIKSEYGSTLDDEQRHADASDALAAANLPPSSEYSSDREEEDGDGITSMLGLQSYWDDAYSHELLNFREHGHAGEVWFGEEVMEAVASWARSLCIAISQHGVSNCIDDGKHKVTEPVQGGDLVLSTWNVLDVGTGNGLLLHELAKKGFSDLTGADYSEGAINLARGVAQRDGFTNINFLVDDILESKLQKQFSLVVDKGTLDAIGLHPDGPVKRIMYWDSMAKLVFSGGLLVITSCNSTKDELIQEVECYNRRKAGAGQEPSANSNTQEVQQNHHSTPFQYLDHVKTYHTFVYGGVVGTRIATVAFVRN